jgi:hypothetical protein
MAPEVDPPVPLVPPAVDPPVPLVPPAVDPPVPLVPPAVDPPVPLVPPAVDPPAPPAVEPPEVPVLGGTEWTGGRVGPVVGSDDALGDALADGEVDGVLVVADSTGLAVVLACAVGAGWPVARGRTDAVVGRDAHSRSFLVGGNPRRGSASMIARALGTAVGGGGVGLGRACNGAPPSPRSGSGRIALELTGPPARLTLMSPP